MKTGTNIFAQNNNSRPAVNLFANSNNSSSQNLLSPNNIFARNSQNVNNQNISNVPNSSNNSNAPNISNNSNVPNIGNNSNTSAIGQQLLFPPRNQGSNQDNSHPPQNYPEVMIQFSLIYQKILQGIQLSEKERDSIKKGGTYFQTSESQQNQEKKNYFEKNIKDRDHIGFGFREKLISGDIPKCKFIDQIWIKLIKHFTHITQSNQMIGYELIKKEVIHRKLYQKFYSPVLALNNKVFKLNQEQVEKFYVIAMPQQQRGNQQQGQQQQQVQSKVDIENPTYKQILQSMTTSYFKQYLSYLDILFECVYRFKQGKKQKIGVYQDQFFKGLVKGLIQIDIVNDLWKKYKALWKVFSSMNKISQQQKKQVRSANQSPSKVNLVKKNPNQLIQKVILMYKKQIFEDIGRLILLILQNVYTNQRLYLENPIKQVQILKFIADDNLHCDITLKLLLKLFPWKLCSSSYLKQSKSMGSNKPENSIQKIDPIKKKEFAKLIENIQDDRFIGFKMIPDFFQYKQKQNDRSFEGIPWEELFQNGTWNMFGSQWRYWLGLLLQYVPEKQIFQNKELANHILQLCKTVVCQNLEQFWEIKNFQSRELSKNESFDLYQIGKFMKSYSNQYGLQFIMPILTKALQSNQKVDYCQNVVEFVGIDQMKIIIQPIRQNLDIKMFQNQQPEQQKDQNEFTIQVGDPNIEQQLKFIQRFVNIKIYELSYLQSVLFSGEYQQIDNRMYKQSQQGLKIMSFLLVALSKIEHFHISSIKCIRYILKTLDCFFCYQHTRKTLLFLMSLYFSQLNKESNNKNIIYELVTLCMTTNLKGQMKRQVQKLRFTLSNHLCNMLRLSDCISDNFKVNQYFRSHNYQNKGQLQYILQHLSKGQYEYVQEYLSHDFQIGQFNWFFDIIRLIQHPNLLPIDYQSIYLILQKMRIRNMQSLQAICMIEISQILNNSTVSNQIFQCVRPQYKKGNLFDLSNFDIMSFFKHDSLEPQNIQQRNLPKYQNKSYSSRKLKKTIIKEKNNILGKLNGSLRVIEAILKLRYQGDYELVDKLSLTNQIIEKLTQRKKLVNYKIHTVDYQYHEWQTNIHLALSSYLDLQEDQIFLQREQKSYYPYNRKRNINIPIIATTDGAAIGFNQKYICSQFFQNLMHSGTDMDYSSDYSIKGIILRIYQLIFFLGKGSVIKNCLNNRQWSNQLQLCQNSLQFGKNVETFIVTLIQILQSENNSKTVYTQTIELLILMINQDMFLEKLLENLSRLKIAIEKILLKVTKNLNPTLDIRILCISAYLVYNLILVNSSDFSNNSELKKPSIKYELNHIKRFIEYPSNILLNIIKCLKKMNKFQLGKVYDGDDIFSNYHLQIKANRSTLYKTTFHIILKTFSLYFSSLAPSVVLQFIELIIPDTNNFVMQPPNVDLPIIASKINLFQKNPLKYSQDMFNLTMWQFPINHFNKIMSQYYNPYGQNYQFDYFTAYGRLKFNKKLDQENLTSQILSLQRVNCLISLWHSHVYMVQTYVYVLLKILRLGPYGYSMSNYFVDENLPSDYIDQIKEDKFFTDGVYDSLSLIGKNEESQYKNLMFLFKTFLEYLEFNGKMFIQEPKNLIAALQKQKKKDKKQIRDYKSNIKPSLDACILLLNQILCLIIKVVPKSMNVVQNLQVIKDIRDRFFMLLCGQLKGCTLRVHLLGFNIIIQTDLKLQQLKKKYIYEQHQRFKTIYRSSNRESIFEEKKSESVINQVPLLQEVANILTCGLRKKISYLKLQRNYSVDDILGNCMLFSSLCQTILHKFFEQIKFYQQKKPDVQSKSISKRSFAQINKQSSWEINQFQLRHNKEKLMMIQNIIYQLLQKIKQIDQDLGRISILNLAANFIQLKCKLEVTVEKQSRFRFFQNFLNSILNIMKDIKTSKIERAVCFNILQGLIIYDNGEVCKNIADQLLEIMSTQTFFEYQIKNDSLRYAISQKKHEEISLRNQKKQHQKIYNLRSSTNTYSTLTDLFQINGLLGLICSFMTHQQNWSSLSKDKQVLDQFFIQVLFQDILIIDSSKIVPTNKGQFKAKQVIVYQKKPKTSQSLAKGNYYYHEINKPKNQKKTEHLPKNDPEYSLKPTTIISTNQSLDLFTFVVNLKISETLLFQLLIIKQGIQKSGRFRDLIRKTLRTKSQEINSQKMWKILQNKIVKFCHFYNFFIGLFESQNLMENIIKIYDYTSKQASYWTNFEGLTFLFNEYTQEQFYYHIVSSIILLGESCLLIYSEWQDGEWQYAKDWKAQRNQMMAKTYQLFKKINMFVSLRMKQSLKQFQKIEKELKYKLKQEISMHK